MRDRIIATGLFVPSNDWEDRLDLEQPWRIKPSRSRASAHEPAPPVAARSPVGASLSGGTPRGDEAKPVKRLASTAKSDKSDDDDESPWTKEGSRGTYRTLCVRTCDGFYWPISFSTSKDNLGRDAKICERSCGVPARLYFHENPGQEPDEMEDQRGKRYKDLKSAYLYRTQYNAACTCKPQPWDEAALGRHQAFAEAAARKGSSKLSEAEIKRAAKASSRKSEIAQQIAVARQDRMASEAAEAAAQLASALPAELIARSVVRRQTLLWSQQPAALVVPAHAHQSLVKHVARHLQIPVSTPGAAIVLSATRPREPVSPAQDASQHHVSRPRQSPSPQALSDMALATPAGATSPMGESATAQMR